MGRSIHIAIIGDFDPAKPSHPATVQSIRHATACLAIDTRVTWLPTPSFQTAEDTRKLDQFDCLWISPGSPYRSQPGAMNAIRAARETGKPFFSN